MSYQVLARKWRPRTFKAMVGQEHVLKALINALDNQRLHHAYLFTGTRGVGKTTIARILAKCFNCESGISSTPCGTCNACQEIDQGRFIDLIEVDAASRTKVEDTRELLDNVQYAPTRGRFKVYLIDEVHMLSGHSFNALLKTLEEPPPHIKFLLATTDPQRLPITILSRCLQFNLKNMLPETIFTQLQTILEQENIPFEKPALQQISRAADGSMRDALSLLDQAIAFSAGKITTAETSTMLGTIEQGHIYELLEAIATNDPQKIIKLTQELAEQGKSFANALDDMLSLLHQIALIQTVPANAINTDCFDNSEMISGFAKRLSKEDVQLYYQIGLIGKRDLPLAPNPKHGFEMVLLRMLAFRPALLAANQQNPPTATTTKAQSTALTTASSHPTVTNQSKTQASDEWSIIVNQLQLTGLTQALANHCSLQAKTETHIELLLDASQAALLNPRQQERLNQALNQYFGKPYQLTIQVANATTTTSPAAMQKSQHQQRIASIAQSIENDIHVQILMQKFDAKLQTDSIQFVDTAPAET